MVCDGDSYFTELVRYIHLNPLRVGLARDLRELESYPYCGHGVFSASRTTNGRIATRSFSLWLSTGRAENIAAMATKEIKLRAVGIRVIVHPLKERAPAPTFKLV